MYNESNANEIVAGCEVFSLKSKRFFYSVCFDSQSYLLWYFFRCSILFLLSLCVSVFLLLLLLLIIEVLFGVRRQGT